MKILVTGSAGHLGEALMRIMPNFGHEVVGFDLVASPFTTYVGSITNRKLVRQAMVGVDAVLHTATLHKPHVATHTKQDFIDTNISGTLILLEEAAAAGIKRFVYTSTTSAFGAILRPLPTAPATWVDETLGWSSPKNIYGVTKRAGEDMCALFAAKHGINCIVLRTSRFFPEADDSIKIRSDFPNAANSKANEFLFRRVDLEDAAIAHELALQKTAKIRFGKYIISATSPFKKSDLKDLRSKPAAVVSRYFPDFAKIYHKAGFKMFTDIGRVYVNRLARDDLGWVPKYNFAKILEQINKGVPIGSELSRIVGIKGYHAETFENGPYPVEKVLLSR